jgi:SAM-dependent methyltransferase
MTTQDTLTAEDLALLRLLITLKSVSYRFVTPTPASHARVLMRGPDGIASDMRDVFGWSRAFAPGLLPEGLLERLKTSAMVETAGELIKSRVRISSLGPDLFLHSAYPTEDKDAVFFGPDSYRFARLITHELARNPGRPGARLLDIGAGAGVGAIVASHCCPGVEAIMMDINPAALRFARINAVAAGVRSALHLARDLSALSGEFDIILANPPFIVDDKGRDYRDGGSQHGAEIALNMTREAVARLAPGGRFILYTGSAITAGGKDNLADQLSSLAAQRLANLQYEELDPDIFGEELEKSAYRDVERIALVCAIISVPDGNTGAHREQGTPRAKSGMSVAPLRLIAGLGVGLASSILMPPTFPSHLLPVAEPMGRLWLDALAMTVVPLLFGLLTTGIASACRRAAAGGTTVRAMLWFAVMLIRASLGGMCPSEGLLTVWPVSPHGLTAGLPAARLVRTRQAGRGTRASYRLIPSAPPLMCRSPRWWFSPFFLGLPFDAFQSRLPAPCWRRSRCWSMPCR